MGLEALLSSAVQESRAHLQLAQELEKSIAQPFSDWSEAHKGRIRSSRSLIEAHLVYAIVTGDELATADPPRSAFERKHAEVLKLKVQYDDACRHADAAEDELAFLKGTAVSTPDRSASPSSPAVAAKSPPPTPAPAPAPPAKSRIVQDGSEDGLDDIDDDENMIGRSGATGGSITAALGRAFTVRRKQLAGTAAAASGKEVASMPFTTDPNVGAALDWSKSTYVSLCRDHDDHRLISVAVRAQLERPARESCWAANRRRA